MQNIEERASEVLKQAFKEKKDNLIKMSFDLYYRSKRKPIWEKKIAEMEKEMEGIDKEIDTLRIAGGKSTKSRVKMLELDEKKRGINVSRDELLKAIHQLAVIKETLESSILDTSEYFKNLEEVMNNPEVMYNELRKTIKI